MLAVDCLDDRATMAAMKPPVAVRVRETRRVESGWITQQVLEAGIGDDLRAALSLVAESTWYNGATGEPCLRFTPRTCRDLARLVVCRAYAPALWEVVHFLSAAEAASEDMGWVGFLWADAPASAQAFRARFAGLDRDGATADRDEVTLTYGDEIFSISYGRMPLAAAFVEFLIGAVGFPALDDAIAPALAAKSAVKQQRGEAANRLASLLHHYLAERLCPAQSQRKLAAMLGFLEQRGDLASRAITDEAVLAFWLAQSETPAEGVDFRTFRAVLDAFADLLTILAHAPDLAGLERSLPLGPDGEKGEIDPDRIAALVESIDDAANPLARLGEDPAGSVKFLTGARAEMMNTICRLGPAALVLCLSVLRADVFGHAQARLTQALRRRAGSAEIEDLCHHGTETDYTAWQDDLAATRRQIDTALLACAHVLAQAGRARLPEDAARNGAKAFKSITRQGFAGEPWDDPTRLEAFAAGADALVDLADLGASFAQRLEAISRHGDWGAMFAKDRPVFARQFSRLYGSPMP